MLIVTMVAILNYYKSIIRRDKEIQNARRALLEKQKMDELLLEAEQAALNREMFLKKMLQYSDRCYDIHALIYRPREYDFTEQNVQPVENSTELDAVNDGCNTVTEKNEFVTLKEKDTAKKRNEKADTSKIVYVLVAVLLGSLIKAALDLTKHYKKVYFNGGDLSEHKLRLQILFCRKTITKRRMIFCADVLFRNTRFLNTSKETNQEVNYTVRKKHPFHT